MNIGLEMKRKRTHENNQKVGTIREIKNYFKQFYRLDLLLNCLLLHHIELGLCRNLIFWKIG